MRNMTARSYSDATLKQKNSENGSVIIIKRTENAVDMSSMQPASSPSAVHERTRGRYKSLNNFTFFNQFSSFFFFCSTTYLSQLKTIESFIELLCFR